MSGLDLALVNAALANARPGARASRIEIIEHISGNGRAVSRIALETDSASGVRLPPTMIAKWTTQPAHLPEVRSEIATHRTVLMSLPNVPAPTCHGWVVREKGDVALLLTDDLSSDHDRPELPVPLDILERIVEAIAHVHAACWDGKILADERFASPMPRPTRMPQAVPAGVIRANAAAIREPIKRFLTAHDQELSPFEKRLLASLADHWGELFLERVRDRHSLTLIHGDLHLLATSSSTAIRAQSGLSTGPTPSRGWVRTTSPTA